MKKLLFTGAGCAIVTPFNEDMSVNYDALKALCEFQIAGGTDAIIICGTTGEASTLTHEEHLNVIKCAVETVAGRIPVIAGTGSNDTAYACELTVEAAKLGVDGTLQVTPYYNKTSQAGLIAHFTKIADCTDLPMILYSVGSRTNLQILPETCRVLAQHPNIVGIKEASDNISQVTHIASLCGDDLAIYSGCDDLVVPIMSVGGKGVISVVSNVAPKVAHDIPALYLEGKVEESRALQLEYYDLCKGLFCDVNPIPVKAALNIMGMNAGPCRLPLVETSDENKAKIRAILERHNIV